VLTHGAFAVPLAHPRGNHIPSYNLTTFPTPVHNFFTSLWHTGVITEEGKATFGGVNVQKMKWTSSGRERMSEVARIFVGTVLFALVIGIWVYLWVPPTPGF